jgi:hypothetical protein
MTITVEQVLAMRPCPDYPEERLRLLFPATLHEVLTRWDGPWESVTAANRIWLAIRVLPEPLLGRWLAVVVERVLMRFPKPDPRSLAVPPYLRRGLAVPDAVCQAAADAWTAADATTADASASAYAAAAEAADAADAARRNVDAYASSYTERRRQLDDLLRMVEKEMP